jgi:hypothetical protein
MLADAKEFVDVQRRRDEVLSFLRGRLTPELYEQVERQLRGCYLVRHANDPEQRRTFRGY